MTMGHRRFIHQAAHCTELVVSTLNSIPQSAIVARSGLCVVKWRNPPPTKKWQTFKEFGMKYANFLNNAWELTHTLSRCVSFRQNVFTLLHVLIFYAAFFPQVRSAHSKCVWRSVLFLSAGYIDHAWVFGLFRNLWWSANSLVILFYWGNWSFSSYNC